MCNATEKKDTQKLHSNLNTILAKLCRELPQLFVRLAGEYPTSEEALDQAKNISDKAFSESAEDELGRVRAALAYDLDNWIDFVYQIQGELEEGVERVIKAEEREVDSIIKLKLQEVQVAQEKAEQLKKEAIQASDAQFVWVL
jgi:hypothetical protein